MPDPLLEDGLRFERTGALDDALVAYRGAAQSASDATVRAEALTHSADVHRARCEWEEALTTARQAQRIARNARLEDLYTDAMIAEANVHTCRGEYRLALPVYEHIAESSANARHRGIALQNIGTIRAQSGQPRAAERAFSESLGNFHKAEYSRGVAMALNNLGRLSLEGNDSERAIALLEHAVLEAKKCGDTDLVALASMNLASGLFAAGDRDRAQELAMSSLGYFAECRNHWREIECLRLVGQINECREEPVEARRCYDRALLLAQQMGSEVEARLTRDRIDAMPRH